ncbi:MAG: DUF881 domain-containing protein [Actinomycetes bacterium]
MTTVGQEPAAGASAPATDGRQERALVRHRLVVAIKPRATRGQAAIGLLFVLLGFGLALQVRSTEQTDGLSTARESDLVRILDDLTSRNERLAAEQRDLQATRDRLASGGDTSTTALQEARLRAQTLGILAGTLAAQGPGVVLTVTDPTGKIDAATLLDVVEELRDAGAEAIQVGDVRIVAQTAFVDGAPGALVIDGHTVSAPYTVLAIGDSHTLSAALRIPGGVVESLRNLGGDGIVQERDQVEVTALRPASTPQYAHPASSP